MLKILETVLIAFIGGIIGYKIKIPAGGLIGAMISVGIYNYISGEAYIPIKYKLYAQIVIGGIIGLNFTRDTIKELQEIALPIIISVCSMVFICIVIGFIIFKVTNIDLATALFCMAPGGITDIALAAQDMGAVTSTVIVFHFARLVLVISFMPTIIKVLSTWIK